MGEVSRPDPLRRDRLRRRRSSHADRGPPPAAAALGGRPARVRAARRVGRTPARPSAAHPHSLRRRSARACCKASPGMDGRSSTRMFPSRSRCGTCGRRSPPSRSPSSRRRRALRSTGGRSRPGARAASPSRRSRTPPASRRPATPALDRRLPFDEFYRIPDACASAVASREVEVRARHRDRDERRPRARIGRGRPTEPCARAKAWPADASGAAQSFASSTRSSPASISPARAIFELLRAFAGDRLLERVRAEAAERGYRAHEFGDSC